MGWFCNNRRSNVHLFLSGMLWFSSPFFGGQATQSCGYKVVIRETISIKGFLPSTNPIKKVQIETFSQWNRLLWQSSDGDCFERICTPSYQGYFWFRKFAVAFLGVYSSLQEFLLSSFIYWVTAVPNLISWWQLILSC